MDSRYRSLFYENKLKKVYLLTTVIAIKVHLDSNGIPLIKKKSRKQNILMKENDGLESKMVVTRVWNFKEILLT